MWRLARIGVSIGMIGLALYIFDWQHLLQEIQQVDLILFGVAVSLAMLQYVPLLVRWVYLVGQFVALPVSIHTSIFLYGNFLNSFTPANLGSDIYRIAALREGVPPTRLIVTVLRERVVGLLSFLLAYLLFYAWMRLSESHGSGAPLLSFSTAVIAVAALSLLFLPYLVARPPRWLGTRVAGLLKGIREIAGFRSWRDFWILLGLSLLALLAWIAAMAVVAHDLNLDVTFAALGAVAVLTELIRLIPISVQGIGVRESAFAFLISLVGGDPERGFVVATLSYFAVALALLASGGIGWILCLFRKDRTGL